MSSQTAEKRLIELEGSVTLVDAKVNCVPDLACKRPVKRPRMMMTVELPVSRATRGAANGTRDTAQPDSVRTTRARANGSAMIVTPTPAPKTAARRRQQNESRPRAVAPQPSIPTSATSTRSRRREVIEIEIDGSDEDERDSTEEDGSAEGSSMLGASERTGRDGAGGVGEEEEWGFLRGI